MELDGVVSDFPQEQRKINEVDVIKVLTIEKANALNRCVRQAKIIASLEARYKRDVHRTKIIDAVKFLFAVITSRLKHD